MVSEVNFDEYDMNSGLTSPAEHAPHQDEASDVSGAQTEESGAESLLKPEAVSMSLESSTDDVVLEESGLEDPRQSKNYDLVPRRMVALFDYDPSTLSPNPDSEVSPGGFARAVCIRERALGGGGGGGGGVRSKEEGKVALPCPCPSWS